MAIPVQGVGFLLVADVLTDVSFQLLEPIVALKLPASIMPGWQTINAWSKAVYVGAQLLVGAYGDPELEVVTVAAVTPGVSFQAKFVNAHNAGTAIGGPTFPVESAAGDPFLYQDEVLTYLSNALNDFLVECPLAYELANLNISASQQFTALPGDCQQPVRVSTRGFSLRETSQSNLDAVDPRWENNAMAPAIAYYRDKIGLGNVGIWPRQADATPLSVVYQLRGPQFFSLADGFPIPDAFLPYVKARVLEMCYSKDGEGKSVSMMKFFAQRYQTGIKICRVFLEAAMSVDMQ